MNILIEFQKRAAAAGLTKEQTDKFVQAHFLGGKTAEQLLDETFTNILTAAGVEKNAETLAYVEGVLKAASAYGLPDDQAVQVTAQLATKLAQYAPAKPQQKEAQAGDITTKAYLLGMLEKAASLGISEQDAMAFVHKMALADAPLGAPAPQVAPPAQPSAPAAAGPDPAQLQLLIKMLSGVNGAGGAPKPDVIQALLAQAGQGGAPAAAPSPNPSPDGMLKQIGQ